MLRTHHLEAIYCFLIAVFATLNLQAATYYVATTGDDNNPGTIGLPWATWQKAVTVSVPGDTTYIRGGVYKPTNYIGFSSTIGICIIPGDGMGVSGTAEAPICYFNYPGETPVLDGSLMTTNIHGWLGGIDIIYAQYIHFRGLTVCNIHQSPPDFSRPQKPYSEVVGIGSSGANIRYENMTVHDVDGRGFQHWSYAWNEFDGPDALFESDSTVWINCDAYNLFDQYSLEPGNAADGWKVHGYYSNHYYWEGCRAWNYSDDGFDPSGQAFRTFKNCWAMSTDKYKGVSDEWDIEGNGFKLTGVRIDLVPDYVQGEKNFVRLENCIAANCVGVGFYNNILVNYDDQWPNGGILYNNFSYKNNIGFSEESASILRNNIVYDSQDHGPVGEKYEISAYLAWYTESNNTWVENDPSPGSWPWWEYNPAFNVTDDDFVSLDYSQLTTPRKPDGSLPDITFGHLRDDSELIDAGIDVGLPFSGTAPDIGAFEYSPPDTILLQNRQFGIGNIDCFDATQTITTAGNGTIFIVEDGGTVDLIAGQNIIMHPGTQAIEGSYFHASITTEGLYCRSIMPIAPPAPTLKSLTDNFEITTRDIKKACPKKAFFNVYPNPTKGQFIVDLSELNSQGKFEVAIYGVGGRRIQQKNVFGNKHPLFSIEGQLPGVYIVQVRSNKKVGAKRIIKQ